MAWWLIASIVTLALIGLAGCDDDKSAAKTTTKPPTTARTKGFPKLPCDAQSQKTEKDGKVLGCVITEDTRVGPITCAGGERVQLFDTGKLEACTLAKAHAWDGVPCAAASSAKWFRSGKLAECGLDRPYARSGLACRSRIALQENGRLHRCHIDADAKLGHLEIPGESWVTLDRDGKPARVKRPTGKPLQLESYRCAEVHYYPSGKVKICVTAAMTTLQGKRLPVDTRLCLDEQGELTSAIDAGCYESQTAATPDTGR